MLWNLRNVDKIRIKFVSPGFRRQSRCHWRGGWEGKRFLFRARSNFPPNLALPGWSHCERGRFSALGFEGPRWHHHLKVWNDNHLPLNFNFKLTGGVHFWIVGVAHRDILLNPGRESCDVYHFQSSLHSSGFGISVLLIFTSLVSFHIRAAKILVQRIRI